MGLLLLAECYSSQQIAVIQDAVGQKCSAADEFTKVVVPQRIICQRPFVRERRGAPVPAASVPSRRTPFHPHRRIGTGWRSWCMYGGRSRSTVAPA